MTTLKDIEKREAELNQIETRARSFENVPIPERRFGAGVTREQQRAAYSQRQQGRQAIQQIKSERGQLQTLRGEVQRYNQSQAQLKELTQQRENYQKGFDLAFKGDPRVIFAVPYLGQAGQRGYAAGKEYINDRERYEREKAAYDKQINDLKAQGLTPVYSGGTITGFEDSVRGQSIGINQVTKLSGQDLTRYETAGVISSKPGSIPTSSLAKLNVPLMTTNKGIIIQTIQSNNYKPIFGRVEETIQYPFEKAAQLYERIGDTKSPSQVRFAGAVVSYPVYGLRRVEEIAFNPTKRQEFKQLSPIGKAAESSEIALSGLTAFTLGRGAYKKAIEPINVQTIKTPTQNFAETKVYNIKKNDKVLNVAEFEVKSITPAAYQYQVPRIAANLRGFNPRKMKDLSIDQLKVKFPEGKLVPVQPSRVAFSKTEPFILDNGKIIGSLNNPRRAPGVVTARASQSIKTGRIRVSSKDISVLRGENYGRINFNNIGKSRNQLSKTQQKAIEELEKVKGPEGLDIRKTFTREGLKRQKIDFGNVELTKLAKLTNKGINPVPLGRTKTRAEVTTIQKRVSQVKYDRGPLKELEILSEDIAAIDVTFPRIRKPKEVLRIKGKTTRKEFEIPSGDDGFSVLRPGSIQKTDLKTTFGKQDQKTIQKAIGDVAIQQQKVKTPDVKSSTKPINVQEQISPSVSAFSGTGLYERTDEFGGVIPSKQITSQRIAPDYTLTTKNLNKPLLKSFTPLVSGASSSLQKQAQLTKVIPRAITKQTIKLSEKQVTKSIEKVALKEVTKQIPKQVTKLAQKQVPKISIITRVPPSSPPKIPKTPRTPLIPFLPLPGGNQQSKGLVQGFKPFVIKDNKKLYLDGVFTKQRALKIGQQKALGSLRATFGVEPTKIKVKGQQGTFKVNQDLFRNYRVRGGKKIKLDNTYIQKQGKRLSTGLEKREIQNIKRFKI